MGAETLGRELEIWIQIEGTETTKHFLLAFNAGHKWLSQILIKSKLTFFSYTHVRSLYQEPSLNAVACPWLCSTRDTKQSAIENTFRQKCLIEIFSNSVPLRQQGQRYTTALGDDFWQNDRPRLCKKEVSFVRSWITLCHRAVVVLQD